MTVPKLRRRGNDCKLRAIIPIRRAKMRRGAFPESEKLHGCGTPPSRAVASHDRL
jgi:hypothetical protein